MDLKSLSLWCAMFAAALVSFTVVVEMARGAQIVIEAVFSLLK